MEGALTSLINSIQYLMMGLDSIQIIFGVGHSSWYTTIHAVVQCVKWDIRFQVQKSRIKFEICSSSLVLVRYSIRSQLPPEEYLSNTGEGEGRRIIIIKFSINSFTRRWSWLTKSPSLYQWIRPIGIK
jgi:hypothetical protein